MAHVEKIVLPEIVLFDNFRDVYFFENSVCTKLLYKKLQQGNTDVQGSLIQCFSIHGEVKAYVKSLEKDNVQFCSPCP